MSDFFGAFYDTEAELLKNSGDEFSTEITHLRTIKGDMQFSSSHLGDKEYGFGYEKNARLYCANADAEGISEGDFVCVKGITYRIEHIENREMGALLILKSTSAERRAL